MVYTLGHRMQYLQGMADAPSETPFQMMGPRADYYEDGTGYLGGSVWETAKEVRNYLALVGERLAEYSVFEIDANWETETVQAIQDYLKGYPFRRLAVDATVLREIPNNG